MSTLVIAWIRWLGGAQYRGPKPLANGSSPDGTTLVSLPASLAGLLIYRVDWLLSDRDDLYSIHLISDGYYNSLARESTAVRCQSDEFSSTALCSPKNIYHSSRARWHFWEEASLWYVWSPGSVRKKILVWTDGWIAWFCTAPSFFTCGLSRLHFPFCAAQFQTRMIKYEFSSAFKAPREGRGNNTIEFVSCIFVEYSRNCLLRVVLRRN